MKITLILLVLIVICLNLYYYNNNQYYEKDTNFKELEKKNTVISNDTSRLYGYIQKDSLLNLLEELKNNKKPFNFKIENKENILKIKNSNKIENFADIFYNETDIYRKIDTIISMEIDSNYVYIKYDMLFSIIKYFENSKK